LPVFNIVFTHVAKTQLCFMQLIAATYLCGICTAAHLNIILDSELITIPPFLLNYTAAPLTKFLN